MHASTVIHRKQNHIWAIQDERGHWKSSRKDIGNYLINNFQLLFDSYNPVISEELESLYTNAISDQENRNLCLTPTDEEMKDIIWEMNNLKLSGPDGMYGVFYRNYWEITDH